MSANLLSHNHLPEFLLWCSQNGYEVLPLKGAYEVFRIKDKKGKLHIGYHRNTKSKHFTITGEWMEKEVRRFIRERNRALDNEKEPIY
jgi:hypothetical protein